MMKARMVLVIGLCLPLTVGADPAPAPPAGTTAPAAPGAAAAPEANAALTAALADADKAYRSRNMKASQAALDKATGLAPKDFEVLWRLARHYFTVAEDSRSDDEKKTLGKKGWDYADQAIAANPKHPAGHFWASAAVGEFSKGAGIITALRQGIAARFERYANATIRYSKRYEDGGGYRALGRYYYELPWPKRDLEKSIDLLRKSVQFGPHKARNYAWLAESLIKEGEEAEAKKVLQQCATVDPNKEDPADGRKFKPICAKLLKDL